jgi:hypothetical protein
MSYMDNNTNDRKSLHSHNSSNKKNSSIPLRINFIKDILKDNALEPLVNFNNNDTDNFKKKKHTESESYDSNDTRYVLNKKIHDFYKVINKIGGKLIYIKSGTTGHTFKGIYTTKRNDRITYAVKVVAYPKKEKYGKMSDIKRPENAELLMIKLLSYFVVNKQTPHIVLPIGTFNTSIKPFVSLIEDKVVDDDNKKYKQFIDRHKKKEYYEHVSILISEWANKGDFLDFLRRNYKKFDLIHWKVFFFQILSVLAIIQSKFPSFRHNDLKANNILIHKNENNSNNSHNNIIFRYTVANNIYIVPNIGYQIKLWDFDFACIPGIVDNDKVNAKWTDKINVIPSKNRYYDVHYFFNTLGRRGFFPELRKSRHIPSEVKKFVDRIVPKEYKKPCKGLIAERGRILIDIEYTTPNKILKNDPFFEEFIKRKKKKNK